MNENYLIKTKNEKNTFHNNVISEVNQKISNAMTDTENTSKEKYTAKQALIEAANDMTTQEKIDAMDENFNHRNIEHVKSILILTIKNIITNKVFY
ncbi:hypothetical protein SAMN02910289_00369 [Lachnospiraceae bacterium RM5]|nr:hypothetical protein SAMN02910289_00369 [Lachnospiraceae bacterium RM5]